MATYTFDVRRDRVIAHTAQLTIEADNIADAIEQARRLDTRDAAWVADSFGYWDDTLIVDNLTRTHPGQAVSFLEKAGEPIGELGLAWFKRLEAKTQEAAA